MNRREHVKSSSKQAPGSKSAEPLRSRASSFLSSQQSGQLYDHKFFGRKMRAYVARIQFDVIDFSDPKLSRNLRKRREMMEAILIKKKIPRSKARMEVLKTLNIAANHTLVPLRRAGKLDELKRTTARLRCLIILIEDFLQVLVRLPPRSKGKLNTVISKQDLRNFDSEVFSNFVHAINEELSKVSPAVVGGRARLVLKGASFQTADDSALAKTLGGAPAKILDLWETIPAQTRAHVEADVRSLSRCKSAVGFLQYLINALQTYFPQAKRGRRAAIERMFAQKVAAVWRRLGLLPGRAYFPGDKNQPPSHQPSSFQRYCDLALAAVGEKSRISGRQVANLKPKP